MIGLNGGLIGARRLPTTSAAVGVWTPNEQVINRRLKLWPFAADPDFGNVSLLLPMDGSNGSTTFTDVSSNALTVTANGNAQISTAQSKWGGSSGLFDGNGDFLSASPTDPFSFSTNAFTIEFWVRYSSVSTYSGIIDTRSAANFSSWLIGLYTVSGTNRIDFVYGASRLTTNAAVSANTWTHVAVVRNAGLISIYLDGTADSATVSYGSAINATTGARIGGSVDPTHLNGYIDDLRITKSVARYTANFTPPAAAFPYP